MWKKPFRPRADNGVSQTLNDGWVKIYSVTDGAAPGYKPAPVLTQKLLLHYAELRVGIQRAYLAEQNMRRVDKLIRVRRAGDISNLDIAETEDGKRYRIDLVQTVDNVYPPCLDLTLYSLDQGGST